jgi:peroxiredoxin-like protein
MQDLPHHYKVSAEASADSLISLEANNLPTLQSAPPAEYGGPGDQWSPETLLTAAVADCFILTFKAIARASKLDWQALRCNVTGTLARVERTTCFTEFTVQAQLQLPAGADADKANRLLEKAEANCLITNSMKSEVHLETDVQVAG